MNKGHIGEIIANFRDKPVNQNLLKSFCERNKYEVITPGQLEEYIGQQEHDERVNSALPFIFAELAKYQHIPEFVSDERRKSIVAANEDIEWKVAKIIEDTNLPYGREIDVVFGNLARAMHGIFNNAGTRMNNMCASALSAIAKEKFGAVITVKQLATYYRESELKPQKPAKEAPTDSDQL